MRFMMFCCICALTLLLTGCAMPAVADQARAQSASSPAARSALQPTNTATLQNAPTVVATHPPANCPITRPQQPLFVPPPPNHAPAPWPGMFWYGTESLWTALPESGVWSDLPHNPEGYTQKILWWRKGYFWKDEPEPELHVTARRLDEPAPSPNISSATNAFAEDIQSAMLVGVDFSTLGCWEISGQYGDTELAFVIWIAP